MKVIAQTAALQEALSLASSIVAVRTPKPVLQCVKLIASGKTLTLLATDLEAGCRFVVSQVEVQAEGEALVPVGKLADIVRESAGEESLTIALEKDACIISGAGSRFRLLGFDPAEYPPVADFEDTELVKVVELDEACRRQQLGEGWFDSLDEVPKRALTQTIPAVGGADRLIVVVPEKRKAEAVRDTILGPVATSCPASILRRQRHAALYLDEDSASGLDLAGA